MFLYLQALAVSEIMIAVVASMAKNGLIWNKKDINTKRYLVIVR